MQYTENYSLKLPGYGDNADVGDLNDNTTAIDALIHANRQIEAPAFSTDTAYTAGDMVVYENVLYKFTADKAAGNWDSTKVTATNLADEVTDAAQSGGTEVEANPVEAATADLHKLKVENTVYGIPDPTVTKTATGNPIEITDGADAPLVKCVTAITGSQDLHGYDKPWVGGAGKNKCAPYLLNDTSQNGIIVNVQKDNAGNIIGYSVPTNTASAYTNIVFGVFTPSADGTYIVSGAIFENASNDVKTFLWDETAQVNVIQTIQSDNISVSLTSQHLYMFAMIIRQGFTVPASTLRPMIRLSTETDSTFTPYSNICPITAYTEGEIEVSDGDGNVTTHTTTFPSAIYRGSEDVVGGSVNANMVVDDLGSYTWYKETWGTGVDFYITALQLIIKSPANVDTPANLLCTNYANVSRNVIYNSTTPCISVLPGGVLKVRDSRFDEMTVDEFKTAMSGVMIAYELATPTTSSVTPTNLPIKSLSGYNHIESSTGEMEVEYITQGYQPLVDLIQESQHVYSTQEQIVGKWVDGSDLYERTFELSNPSQSGDISTGQTYDIVFVVSGYYMLNDGNSILSANQFLNVSNYTYVHVEKDGDIKYNITGYTATKLSVTIRYTKTSSNNRSLSKGATDSPKADLSEEKKEIEELPETEEKTVKEAQSEGEEVTEKVETPTEKEENER